MKSIGVRPAHETVANHCHIQLFSVWHVDLENSLSKIHEVSGREQLAAAITILVNLAGKCAAVSASAFIF
jgi:hypothetical protein